MLPDSQYQVIVESSPNMIWRAGTDAKCNYFNKTWLAFTGRAMEQEMGDGWAEGVHSEDFHLCLQIYLDAFAKRQAFEMEYRLKRHDGEYRWINDRGVPFTDAAGIFAGYIGSCIDVTDKVEAQELKKTLEILRRREADLSHAQAIARLGSWSWEMNHNVVYWSNELFRIFGVDPTAFTPNASSIEKLIYPEDLPQCLEILTNVRDGKCVESFECRILHPDGEMRYIWASGFEIEVDATGEQKCLFGTILDITEQRIRENKLRESEARYRALLEQSFDAVLLMDPETLTVVEVNNQFVRWFGWSLPADAPLSILSLMTGPQDEIAVRAERLHSEQVLTPELRPLRAKSGRIVTVERAGGVVTYGDKKLRMITMRDVTNERQLEMALMRDIQFAHRLQQALMTKPVSSGCVEVRTIFAPYQFVSGDVFHLEWRNGGRLLRGYLVDVSGHGLATALQTSAMNVLLHETAELDMSLENQMQWLNRRASQYFAEESFAAAIGFEIDLEKKELRYTGAGITEFLADAGKAKGLTLVPGLFLGITEMGDFSCGCLELQQGDAFYFITDGLSDLMKQAIESKPAGFDGSVDWLQQMAQGDTKNDDATAVCIRILDFQ